MDRRKLLILTIAGLMGGVMLHGEAKAKSNSGSGNSGSGNSGSGNSGSGNSGSGSSGGSDDDDNDDDKDDDDKDDDDKDRDEISKAVKRGDALPLQRVLKAALAHSPGKVIDVKLRRQATGYVYRVKILTQTGRKRELLIDAKTLRILRVK